MKRHLLTMALLLTSVAAGPAATPSVGAYQPNYDSIQAHYQVPEWFRDAKFGIFIHWGVYSVPAYHDEWYPRWMYKNDEKSRKEVFDYHVATYGPQTTFGYKEFIPQFKAENWQPTEWAKLFKASGAKYVVPVAEHHDGFSMYDSDINPWNAVKMGPHRDIIGELRKALLGEGLHFGLSSHRAEHWWFFNGGRTFPSDVQDSKYASLYGPANENRLKLDTPEGKAFLEDWLARCNELVAKYDPELVYFDVVGSWSPSFQPYLQQFVANYYNTAESRGHHGIVTYKGKLMPNNTGVYDIERDISDTARPLPWQTDTSVGVKSWSYIKDETFKSKKQLINEFIDVVSKNGNYLLNIGPRADGTIPDEPREILLAFGQWLGVNGEAIYATRPAPVAAEGPTHPITRKGPGHDAVETPYTASDIRFTASKDGRNIYAICLDIPNAPVRIHSLNALHIADVSLLGSTQKIDWHQDADGLVIQPVTQWPSQYAVAFKLTMTTEKP